MREATARLMKNENQLGTAWLLDDEHALTDWHCVADPAHRRLLHAEVDLAFVIGREHATVKARVVAHDIPTDAALLRLLGPRPLGAGTIRLGPPRGMLKAFFRQDPLTWHAYAYPREAGGQGVTLRGAIDNLDAVFDEGGQLCPVLQISVDNADVKQLKAASGSAVCIDDYAVALIRYTPFGEGKIVYATPIDAIGERFAEVKDQLKYIPRSTSVRHLDCGRAQQWAAVSQAITSPAPGPRRQVFFVYGASGESPDLFERRIKLLEDRDRVARCEQVKWLNGPPGNEPDFLAWTSRAVLRREERDRERLARDMTRLTSGWRPPGLQGAGRRLVLMLPTMYVMDLGDVDGDDRFTSLHGQWLPGLLGDAAFDERDFAGVVVVQSVVYPGTWWRWPPWISKPSRLARHLRACVAEHRRRRLDSDLLTELRRLTVDEISTFLAAFRSLSDQQRADMLAFARTCRSSSEFYVYIQDNLPEE